MVRGGRSSEGHHRRAPWVGPVQPLARVLSAITDRTWVEPRELRRPLVPQWVEEAFCVRRVGLKSRRGFFYSTSSTERRYRHGEGAGTQGPRGGGSAPSVTALGRARHGGRGARPFSPHQTRDRSRHQERLLSPSGRPAP